MLQDEVEDQELPGDVAELPSGDRKLTAAGAEERDKRENWWSWRQENARLVLRKGQGTAEAGRGPRTIGAVKEIAALLGLDGDHPDGSL